ncbi:MAG TPA: hypothetical protein VL356_02560 [Acidocella sp.]|jgi:hypothetical protein|nr:hypothetical protein [Acidocella sp.]
MILSRRALLGSTVAACALAGCTTSEVAAISAAAVTYLGEVETALTALSPVLPTIAGIPAATVTTIQSDLSKASSIAKTISSATITAVATVSIGQVVTYATDGLKIAAGFALPANVQSVISALQIVLPVLAASAGLSTGAVAAPAPAALDAARATLRNARAILAAG